MPLSRKRILIGRFFHESHGFNPHPTRADRFEILRGDALRAAMASSGTTLGGIARKLDDLGYDIVASVSASAAPSGPVDHDFYVSMRDELLTAARDEDYDAVALELHGAMCTTEIMDAEGDLLTRLRELVGPDRCIAVGLDLHAHMTPAMLQAIDICIACKENPHADVVQCGERVAECLDAVRAGRLRPVSVMTKVPMLLPGAQETTSGPLFDLHARARALRANAPSIWDISLFNVFRSIDDVDIGQAVTVLSDGNVNAARAAAAELAGLFWGWRERFRDNFLTIEDALNTVARQSQQRPFTLADMGDRVLAGAPGDSTAILQHALRHPAPLRGAIPITDGDSAAAAIAAGVGARLTLAVGGRLTPGFAPLEVTGVVTAVSDGDFKMAGPYQAGEVTSHGPTAVLLVDHRLSLMLTSTPSFTHDPAAFTSQGIDPAAQDFLVVKSGYHFKLNFAGIATPLSVASPGIGYYTPGLLKWKTARFWPEHAIAEPTFTATVFDRNTYR